MSLFQSNKSYFILQGGGGDKCFACSKTVYAMERLEIVGKIMHKNCFKCVKCNSKLRYVKYFLLYNNSKKIQYRNIIIRLNLTSLYYYYIFKVNF